MSVLFTYVLFVHRHLRHGVALYLMTGSTSCIRCYIRWPAKINCTERAAKCRILSIVHRTVDQQTTKLLSFTPAITTFLISKEIEYLVN